MITPLCFNTRFKNEVLNSKELIQTPKYNELITDTVSFKGIKVKPNVTDKVSKSAKTKILAGIATACGAITALFKPKTTNDEANIEKASVGETPDEEALDKIKVILDERLMQEKPYFSDWSKVRNKLEQYCNKYPLFAKEIADFKVEDGYAYKGYDLIKIFKAYEINPEWTKEIMTRAGNTETKLSIVKSGKNNKKFYDGLSALKNMHGFSYALYEINNILTEYKDSEHLESIVEWLSIMQNDGYFRFSGHMGSLDKIVDIENLIKAKKINPAYSKILLEMKTKDGEWRFGSEDILNLTSINEENPELLEKLLKEETSKGTYKLVSPGASDFVKAYEKNPELADRLLEMTKNNGKARFNGLGVGYIVDMYEKDGKYTEKLFEMKNPDGSYRFSGYNFDAITKAYTISPNLVKVLLDEKDEDGDYKYDIHDIDNISSYLERRYSR